VDRGLVFTNFGVVEMLVVRFFEGLEDLEMLVLIL
jgi:hypothetical protein